MSPQHRLSPPARRLGRAVLGAFVAAVLIGATALLLSANASAAPGNGKANGAERAAGNGKAHQVHTSPQPASNADFTGHGANVHGPYDSTRDGSPSMNGNGGGNATGRPCAGCVGKADNKNPPGQMPNASDNNAGYECDRNHGIGRTNPAHTGCRPDNPPPPPPPGECPSGQPPVNGSCEGPGGPGVPGGPGGDQPPQAQPGRVPPAAAAGDLASTGVSILLPLLLGGFALAAGAGLVFASRLRRRPTVD